MVFTVLSRALLLVSLLPLCTQSQADELMCSDTLAEFIQFFHEKIQERQYAVAINVPKEQCIAYDKQTFLTEASNVREHLQQHPVYEGTEMIAAGLYGNIHSEDRLMNPPNHSYLTGLLTKNSLDSCVVFYTLLSPCIDSCLNNDPNNDRSILPGLNELNAHTGIKAFAFTHIYDNDQDNHNENYLRTELRKVAERVPLYRCLYKCILCGKPGPNTEIKKECTWETEDFKEFINKRYGYESSNKRPRVN